MGGGAGSLLIPYSVRTVFLAWRLPDVISGDVAMIFRFLAKEYNCNKRVYYCE
jgi:hypothetical protein